MAPINPRLLVKTLTEIRGRILLAFLFAGKAMSVQELATWTGKPRNAHYVHLDALCADGLLAKSSKKMAHGKDVYLLGSEVLPLMQDLAGALGAGRYLEDEDEPVLVDGQMSDLQTPGATPVIESTSRTPMERAALNVALDEYRIVGKSRRKLIECEWVDADYVRAQVEYAKAEPWCDQNPVGAAIGWMLDHTPAPAMRANGHPENCRCAKCAVDNFMQHAKQKSYVGGICPDCSQYPCTCEDGE
jgi:hypothetical protein